MQFFISSLIGYALGSIPTGYLVLYRKSGIDITQTGSGNVGAMNTFEITNSKGMGLLVFIIDFLKGLVSVLLTSLFFPDNFICTGLALIFAITSHCYNPWIKFRGGRGLATAAGGASLLFPFMLIIWMILWVLSYLVKKDILIANILATSLSIVVILLSINYLPAFLNPGSAEQGELLLFAIFCLMIIFTKHIDPLKEIIVKKMQN